MPIVVYFLDVLYPMPSSFSVQNLSSFLQDQARRKDAETLDLIDRLEKKDLDRIKKIISLFPPLPTSKVGEIEQLWKQALEQGNKASSLFMEVEVNLWLQVSSEV